MPSRGSPAEGLASAEAAAGEQISNLRLMIDYAVGHIQRRDDINHDLMQMVRLLHPRPRACPVEIYCFIRNHRMARIRGPSQNDLFDHLISNPPALRAEALPASRRTRHYGAGRPRHHTGIETAAGVTSESVTPAVLIYV